MRDLRCLLISALPPGDSESGDAQYTRDLLANPPEGVTYVPYQDALANGELVEDVSWRRGGLRPTGLAEAATATARLSLHLLRRWELLLPDPVRWWRVTGEFDLVHIHCMPTHLSGRSLPVILTDSAGTFWYWTRAMGREEDETWRRLARERRAARALHYSHPSAWPDAASQALYFVDSGVRFARRLGADPANLGVCPVGVPVPAAGAPPRKGGRPLTLAFVAHHFDIKGGPMAVEIHRRVRETIPGVRLVVAGPEGHDPGLEGVEWLGPKTRSELYEGVYPEADVFVYPTKFDTAALVVTEAIAHGVPVVAPSTLCLPELVRDGVSGFLFPEGDVEQAVALTLQLLSDSALRERMSRAAAQDYRERFSVDVRNRILGTAYRQALVG